MIKEKDAWYIVLSRTVLGVIFLLAGLEGFIELPGFSVVTDTDLAILGSFTQTPHYVALKFVEILLGVLFISNFFIPTALVMSVPVIFNICLFNIWVYEAQGLISLLITIPMLFLFYFYRLLFLSFFKPQFYANFMGEQTPKIVVYDEVLDKAPKKVKEFESLYKALHQ